MQKSGVIPMQEADHVPREGLDRELILVCLFFFNRIQRGDPPSPFNIVTINPTLEMVLKVLGGNGGQRQKELTWSLYAHGVMMDYPTMLVTDLVMPESTRSMKKEQTRPGYNTHRRWLEPPINH